MVKCGTCTQCCQWGNEVEALKPDPRLQAQPNGDCQYLKRGVGCTVWRNRPEACRKFDCRDLLKEMGDLPVIAILIAATKATD